MEVIENIYNKYLTEISSNHTISFLLIGFTAGYLFVKSVKVMAIVLLLGTLFALYYNYSFSDTQITTLHSLFSFVIQNVTDFLKEYINSIAVSEIVAIIAGFLLGIKFG
jgi:uncharacterized membrane protein (Fun14 family)